MGADEVLDRLGRWARGSHQPFIKISDNGFIYFDFSNPEALKHIDLIKKIKTKRTRRLEGRGENAEEWEDEWVEVELYDAKDAAALIGKHHKLFNERVEHTGAGGGPIPIAVTNDRLDRAIFTLADALREAVPGADSGKDSTLGSPK